MKFVVSFSTSGSYETEIEAESREEAIELAYDEANQYGDADWQYEEAYEV